MAATQASRDAAMSVEPAAAPAQRRSPISRAPLDLGAEVPLPARTVSGPVRSGRRTKVLVKSLHRGEIALIDHLDIDRVSAEELVGAGVAAVLNCRPASSGSYPNLGPQLLVEAGILLLDLPDDSLFGALSDGEEIVIVAAGADGGWAMNGSSRAAPPRQAEVLRAGQLLAIGQVLHRERVCAPTEARRPGGPGPARRLPHHP